MKNNIKFDKTRYIELLKKKKLLINQKTSLFAENREEDLELLSYEIILENQLYYNRKAKYTFLLKEYLEEDSGEDGARLFVWEFFKIYKKNNEALEILEKEIIQ